MRKRRTKAEARPAGLPARDPKGRVLGRRGAPTRFSLKVAEEICNRIAQDESLDSICRDAHMPSTVTVYAWTRRYPEFRAAYIQARIDQADAIADRVSDIRKALWCGEMGPATATALGGLIKWETARRNPRGYGNRVTIDDEPEPVEETDMSVLSDEELDTLERILSKCPRRPKPDQG